MVEVPMGQGLRVFLSGPVVVGWWWWSFYVGKVLLVGFGQVLCRGCSLISVDR